MHQNDTERYIDGTQIQLVLYQYHHLTNPFFTALPSLVANYNNTWHTTISKSVMKDCFALKASTNSCFSEMSPNEAMLRKNHMTLRENFEKRYSSLKRKRPRLALSQLVRISKAPSKFLRSYDTQNLNEVFEISKVITTFKLPLYEIKEITGKRQNIKGRFYDFQLLIKVARF